MVSSVGEVGPVSGGVVAPDSGVSEPALVGVVSPFGLVVPSAPVFS